MIAIQSPSRKGRTMSLNAMLEQANRAPLMAEPARRDAMRYMGMFGGGLMTALVLMGPVLRVVEKLAA